MGLFGKKKKIENVVIKEEVKEVEVEEVFVGTKFKKTLSVEEESDSYAMLYSKVNEIIYKYNIALIILNFLIVFITAITLLTRDDTRFFATSPDGRVWELNTSNKPDGNFNIYQHKD